MIMTAALGAVAEDQEFAKTIKSEVYKRLTDRKNRLAKHQAILDLLRNAENNQTFKPLPKRRPEHRNRRNRDGYYPRLYLGPTRTGAPTNLTNQIAAHRIDRWRAAHAAALAAGRRPPKFPAQSKVRMSFIRDIRNPRIREAKEQLKREAFLRDVKATKAFLLQLKQELPARR